MLCIGSLVRFTGTPAAPYAAHGPPLPPCAYQTNRPHATAAVASPVMSSVRSRILFPVTFARIIATVIAAPNFLSGHSESPAVVARCFAVFLCFLITVARCAFCAAHSLLRVWLPAKWVYLVKVLSRFSPAPSKAGAVLPMPPVETLCQCGHECPATRLTRVCLKREASVMHAAHTRCGHWQSKFVLLLSLRQIYRVNEIIPVFIYPCQPIRQFITQFVSRYCLLFRTTDESLLKAGYSEACMLKGPAVVYCLVLAIALIPAAFKSAHSWVPQSIVSVRCWRYSRTNHCSYWTGPPCLLPIPWPAAVPGTGLTIFAVSE